MEIQIDQGLATVIAACVALTGAFIGFVSSQIMEYFRISREAKIRQKEKMVDKMITAHELVIKIADTMSIVAVLESVTDLPKNTDVPVRGVGIVMSLDRFEEWWAGQFHNAHSHQVWLSTKVLHEINYIQDYFVNLHKLMQAMDQKELERLSVVVRPDFIDMSSNLRKNATQFISKDGAGLKFSMPYNRWHKYKTEVTLKKLQATQLFKHYKEFFD